MAEIRFKTEWLTQIALMANCGTAEDVTALCVAIQRAALGNPVDEMTDLVEVLFNPIAEDIAQMRSVSRARSEARKTNENKTSTKSDKTSTKNNKTSTKTDKHQEEKEEREENKEESREESEEVSPQTPLQEVKEESKGETREEREERETCARTREETFAVLDLSSPLPAPAFVAEADPKKLTDKAIEEEFDALWLLYPRKAGKADALRHYKAARKNGTTFDEVEDGINRYRQYLDDEKTDPQYIAMGSTWFCGHRWQDVYARHGPKPGSLAWIDTL